MHMKHPGTGPLSANSSPAATWHHIRSCTLPFGEVSKESGFFNALNQVRTSAILACATLLLAKNGIDRVNPEHCQSEDYGSLPRTLGTCSTTQKYIVGADQLMSFSKVFMRLCACRMCCCTMVPQSTAACPRP